ncbi:hypothetical protein KGM_201014 [Danaus plexippus plexippus]|uniref:Uncharacterized protein n=1 Tax=Danaus plexippus plexippus TaxID=278856 RepID=A0A212FEN6_DANPL|nr:hypothetical protein KGM_201014 [Danaus plexippus plexippus]
MHDAYEKTESERTLYDMFLEYSPQVIRGRFTCVGLGFELIQKWRALDKEFPGFANATGLFSCEEAVVDVLDYVGSGETPESVLQAEKEHVMVGAHVFIDGRPGVILADPGYHVARIVTVMSDRAYPHTGWFIQSEEPCLKEYEYSYSPHNTNYVEWHERVTRGSEVKLQTSLVFVAQPFLDSIDVTEKRNLVYNFRSLLSRDSKGELTAGLYFPVGARFKDATFTLFLADGGERRKTKYKFSAFTDGLSQSIVQFLITQSMLEDIEKCSVRMRYKKRELLKIIIKIARVLSNQSFIDQVLEINDEICRLSL